MRQPKESDFVINLKDVGDFRFALPTLKDLINIRADFLKLAGEHAQETRDFEATDGTTLHAYKELYITSLATIHARHKHLCVEAPVGWQNLDDLPLTQWHEDKLSELHLELGRSLDNFRSNARTTVESRSEGVSADVPVLVS
jgi:hypothetical protein